MDINTNITSIVNDFDFSMTNCDMSDIVTEVSRFMYHILLVHLITYTLDRKDELFGAQLFKTLFVTALAVMTYHILFKKFMNIKLKNIQSVCKVEKDSTENKTNTENDQK